VVTATATAAAVRNAPLEKYSRIFKHHQRRDRGGGAQRAFVQLFLKGEQH